MISIVIVEDLEEIRSGLVQLLKQQEDFLVLSAFHDGVDAMPEIIELQPDIVIMDINMPGMSGIDCIRQIKDHCQGTQFMIFTIYENDEKIVDALAAGASGYLLKKTSPDKMVEAIKELHQGGSPMSSQIARKVIGYFKEAKPEDNNQLTKKENEILLLLSKGFLYKEIAGKLSITMGTVTQHIHHIYEKLHVANRTEAINKVFGRK
ncbi:MAG: response regulator transcription factor [Bacteroidetes bacterium]|nr:response regulator transcription factor [Bacteroidota bacterium]